MIIMISTYMGTREDAEKHLDAHWEFLEKHYDEGKLLGYGPKVPRDGEVIISRINNRAEAEEFVKNDPFCIHNVSKYDFIEFFPMNYTEGLEEFM